MSKHTASEWRMSDNSYWGENPYSVVTSAKGVNRTTIANIPARAKISPEERKANALLIAAAPELLDALLVMLAVCWDLEVDDATVHATALARAAIAKATGENNDRT
jgi:hypothetical protein